jgi:hypothetical protein
MKEISLLSLHRQFEAANIQICFNGPLSHSIIEELGLAVRRYLENETSGSDKMMDVFAVYIEQTQNVRNYAQSKANHADAQIYNAITLMIGRENSGYVVMSGNVVDQSDLNALTGKIDQLQTLDAGGLKALYKEQRRKPIVDGASGAGLGLIDMARKTTQSLTYEVQNIDDNTAFFTLKAVV